MHRPPEMRWARCPTQSYSSPGAGLEPPPGLPTLELPPDLVLMLFLPPLLYSAGIFLFAARPQGQLQADSIPFGRSRAAHERNRGCGRARGDRAPAAGGFRPRGDFSPTDPEAWLV